MGTFSYNGKVYKGILLNVCRFNRERYLDKKQPAISVVRKQKNGIFVLLEEYKYQKQLNMNTAN